MFVLYQSNLSEAAFSDSADPALSPKDMSLAKCHEKLFALGSVLDVLGICLIYKCNHGGGYRLNELAQKDLYLKEEFYQDITRPVNRNFVLETKDIIIWHLQREPSLSDEVAPYLSLRQKEVWRWKQMGKTIEETAIIMGVSKRTVEKHRENIKKKIRETLSC